MYFAPPVISGDTTADPPALVRTVSREQVQWNRPMFKAPPLEVVPPTFDFTLAPVGAGKFVRSDRPPA